MRKIYPLILLLLIIASRGVGQSPTPASKDLVVTAEIVGRKYSPKNENREPELIIYTRMTVRNMTANDRKVAIMKCSWDESWASTGFYNSCSWDCDGNYPISITIPANQALVFYGPLCYDFKSKHSSPDSLIHFRLGFADFTFNDLLSFQNRDELLKSRAVYWSNELIDDINSTHSKGVANRKHYIEYFVTKSGK